MFEYHSENAMSADNQQERPLTETSSLDVERIPPEIGWYLAGFAEGEGSFNVPIRRRNDFEMGWKVSLSFNISQKDDTIPKLFQSVLKCGTIRYRRDGICYFEVTKVEDIVNKVFPFFAKFELRSGKKKDLERFKEIAYMVKRNEHLKQGGLERILVLRRPMNNGGKRRFSVEYILGTIQLMESSEY
ncbi:hypothetical protein HKBW3S42_01148 [Candidatus Hakubella thermalkaliphila]|uniref:Homing endonuclease LAGLIDADG domain-containing protein n=1 Tax=Candidatus Hakubella thermalkaliphila TaxID=2754717 RepID=A0A6V8PPQ6_9ACTN|nr:hypothetical protein HKBW3S42_01148 [Candidatus Hakubella thermalkaliphila]